MGTPDFSVPSLRAIHKAGHHILAVFTQPDKQRGRGKKVSFSPVKECAESLGLPVYQPQTLRDSSVIEELTKLHPDVIVVIAYGKFYRRKSFLFLFTDASMSMVPFFRRTAVQHLSNMQLKMDLL